MSDTPTVKPVVLEMMLETCRWSIISHREDIEAARRLMSDNHIIHHSLEPSEQEIIDAALALYVASKEQSIAALEKVLDWED